MPPPKRKRGLERQPSDAGANRPSPHRPAETNLGRHDTNTSHSSPSRGGRTTRGSNRRDSAQYNNSNGAAAAPPTPTSVAPTVTSPTQPRPPSVSEFKPPVSRASPTPTMPPTPSSLPPTIDYLIVTDERLSRWTKSGRQEVVQYGIDSRDEPDVPGLAAVFEELFYAMVSSRVTAEDAGAIVKEILNASPAETDGPNPAMEEPDVLFLDTVSTEIEHAGGYPDNLREFILSTEISTLLMRQVLDPPMLQELGLTRSTFPRFGIRLSTNLLYRQANYNLLREETEGFSKLITELFTTSNREAPTADMTRATFERVKGLIGTFDLDVGRVLDVTLDVFATVLVKQFRFFIKFLRISSWWPRSQITHAARTYSGGLPVWALPDHYHWMATEEEESALAVKRYDRDVAFWDRAREAHLDAFFELGGRQVASVEDVQRASDFADDPQVDAERTWIKETNTLPSPGNRVAAQLLGFKLRFYASEARDKDDFLPGNLFYLSALLIKVGFISLTDLWPHLWPEDDKMEAVREKGMKVQEEKERAKRPGGGANALERAGALPDDMPSGNTTSSRRDAVKKPEEKAEKEAAEKPELPEPEEQKVRLLENLLLIGAIPEALFILGKHSWIPEAYPDIYPLIHRILHHQIEKVYQDSRPQPTVSEVGQKPLPDLDQTGVAKGSVKSSTPPPKRTLRWPWADAADVDGLHYRYYWDEWNDNVPVCQTMEDFFVLANTFMNLSGVNVGRDPDLLLKLCSIGKKSMAEDQSEQNLARWKELLRRMLIPALSLTQANTEVVSAVWNLVKRYPTHVRYAFYAEWYEGPTSRLGPIMTAFRRTKIETEGYLKRLSKKNLNEMSRALAKTAVSSPGQVFTVALGQVEAYPNLIEVFVQTAKYYTDMGFDVLHWSLLRSLGGKQRSRTQASSVLLTSQWLQRLAELSGQLFTRYSNMNPSTVLQYVNHQVHRGNSTDLVILQQLITVMGGIVSTTNFTDAQLRAMTGGEALRREVLRNLGDTREESARSAGRLMKVLVDSKVVAQLLINIAQYRQSAVFNVPDDEAHVKYLSAVVDDVHSVLIQYLDLLRSNLKPEDFDAHVPDVIRLMKDFGLDTGLAFMITRPSLMARIMNPPPKTDSPQVAQTPIDVDGDVPMESTTQEPTPATSSDDKMELDNGDATPAVPVATGQKLDSFFDPLQPIIEAMPELLPKPQVWQKISPEFYAIFWSLQLGDLQLPQESYAAEQTRLNNQATAVMKDRSDMSRSGMNKKDKLKRDLIERAEAVLAESSQLLERYSKTKFKLARGAASAGWFPAGMAKINSTADVILEQCILPRLQLSATDAEYCFRLIKFLHESQASNFKLMALYDRFFNQNRLRSLLFSCTVREGEHFARFLRCILGELSKWHGSKEVYEKEALGRKERAGVKSRIYHGFAIEFGEDGKPTAWLEHDPFRDLLFKWHRQLMIALKSCLSGMEWMHIRNTITVLSNVIDYFPAVDFMGKQFLDILDTISKREAASKTAAESEEGGRVDLSVLAQSVYSALQKRKPKWTILQAFRPGTVRTPSATPSPPSSLSTQQVTKPQPPAKVSAAPVKVSAPPVKSSVPPVTTSAPPMKASAPTTKAPETPVRLPEKPPLAKKSSAERMKELKEQIFNTKQKLMQAEKTGGDAKDVSAISNLRPNAPEFNPTQQTGTKRTRADADDGEVQDGKDRNTKPGTDSTSLPSKPSLPTKPANKDTGSANLPKPPQDHRSSTRDSTPKSTAPAPTTTTSGRLEPHRPSGLPSRPELPTRPPDVFNSRNGPASAAGRFGRTLPGPDRPPPRDVSRDPRDAHPHSRDPRADPRDQHPRDPRDPGRDHRDTRDPRDPRDARAPEPSRSDRLDIPARPDRLPEYGRQPDRRTPDVAPSRENVRPVDRERTARPDPPPKWNERGPASAQERQAREARELREAREAKEAKDARDFRDSRDTQPRDSSRGGRGHDRDNRGPRDAPAPQPIGITPQGPTSNQAKPHLAPDDRPEIINPARAALLDVPPPPTDRHGDRSNDRPVVTEPHLVNPARAALIGDPVRDPAPPSRELHGRERPPRTDAPRGPSAAPRDEHQGHGRLRQPDQHPSHRDRPSDRDADRNNDRSRGPPPRQPEASDHGRLSQPQQDPNYGRLNPIQSVVNDIPSGPASSVPPLGPRGRGRNAPRDPRVVSGNGPQAQAPPPPPPPPGRPDGRYDSPDRPPPTGPSSSNARGRRGGPYDGGNNSMNPPSVPVAASTPAVSVHPDRLRHIDPAAAPGPQAPNTLPDRPGMNRGGPPHHPQTSLPPLHTPIRPSGADVGSSSRHGSAHMPSHAPPSGPPTPTGPAAGSGSRQPRANRNPFNQVNNILGSAQYPVAPGNTGRNVTPSQPRGRGGRTLLADSDAQVLTGPSPISTPVSERPDPMRRESHTDRSSKLGAIETVNDSRDPRDNSRAAAVANGGGDYESSSRGAGDHSSSSRREHRSDRGGDRSGRPSRRSSRERSPSGRERESKESRDYRHGRTADPSGGPPAAPIDPRESARESARRSARESMSGSHRDSLPGGGHSSSSARDPMMSARESGSHRSSSHRDSTGAPGGVRPHDIPPPPPGRPGGHHGRGGGGGDDYGRGGGSRHGGGGDGGSFRDSRSSRPGDEGGSARKRRSEEGAMGGSEREKRPRRN